MKIHKIIFMNLNSLKGIHEINFSEAPLSGSGLFAITGPTGAGKSTILDAITLALFNQIPRMDKISKEELTKKNAVITHNTNEAFSEVTYEVNGKIWRSKWSIKYNRNNKLNDYHMELAEAETGIPLDINKSQVPLQNVENIGLTYEQFVKAILLSQGEFSRFLKAKKEERLLLLEQISGTGIFRKIGQEIFARYSKEGEYLKSIREQVKMISVLPSDKEEELNSSFAQTNELLKAKKEFLSARSSLMKEILHLQQKENEYKKLEEEKVRAEEENKSLAPQFLRLKNHRKALPLKAAIEAVKELRSQVTKAKNLLEENSVLKKKLEDRKLILLNEIFLITGIKDEGSFSEKIAEFTSRLNELRNTVSLCEASLNNYEAQKKTIYARLPETIRASIKKGNSPVESLKSTHLELAEKIELLEQKESAHWISQKEKIHSRQLKAESLIQLKKQQTELNKQVSILIAEIAETEKSFLSHSQKEAGLKDHLRLLQDGLDQKLKLAENEKAKLKYEEDRKHLKENEPCPLCGSVSHPFVIHYSNDLSTLEQSIKEDRITIKSVEAELRETGNKIAQDSQALRLKKETLQNIKSTGEKIRSEMVTEWGTEETDPLSLKNTLLKESEKISLILSDISGFEITGELMRILEEQAIQNEKKNKALEEKNKIYAGDDYEQKSLHWNRQLSSFNSDLNNCNKKEKELLNDINSLEETLKKREPELMIRVTDAGYSSMENVLVSMMSEEEAEKIQLTMEELSKKLSLLDGSLQTVSKDIREIKSQLREIPEADLLKKEISETELEISRQEKIHNELQAVILNNSSSKKLLQSLTEKLNALNSSFWKWEVMYKLIGDKNGNRFSAVVQEITLKKLIHSANFRLKSLTDRYKLIKPSVESEEIEVIDSYMGQTTRSVRTLSGGETFLVSLALALGLSDLASSHVRLDSLFIDEGFGTLDPETLDTAISTLEKLQAESNKSIGIISHVEELKERIGTQIILEKVPGGISTLRIKS